MSDVRNSNAPVPGGLEVTAAWTWRLMIVAAGAALLAVILYRLRIVTVPIFVALMLTTVILPPVRFLQAKGLPKNIAAALVLVGSFGGLAALFYLLADPVASQFRDLGPQITAAVETVQAWLKNGPLNLSQTQLDGYIEQVSDRLSANAGVLSSSIVSSATLAAELAVGALVALVLTVFFVTDSATLSSAVVNRFPVRHRTTVRAAADRAFHVLSGYLRGVAMTGLVDAFLIGIALVLIGVPLVLPLVVLTFFGAFFPVVGATVAGVLAALVALVNGGPADALLVLVAVVVVQQLEGQVLQPLLVGRAVALHPVVIIIGLTAGGILAGILGAFLAVPLIAVITGVWREVEERRLGPPRTTVPGSESLSPSSPQP